MSMSLGKYLNKESKSSAYLFRHMAQLGFLSVDSQQGRVEKRRAPKNITLYMTLFQKMKQKRNESWKTYKKRIMNAYHALGGHMSPNHIMMRERAYLIGYVYKPFLEMFLYLVNWAGMIAYKPVKMRSSSLSLNHTSNIPVTAQVSVGVEPLGSEWPSDTLPFDTRLQFIQTDENSSKSFQSSVPRMLIQDFLDHHHHHHHHHHMKKIKHSDFVYVVCMDAKFGRLANKCGGLFQVVVKKLQKIQEQFSTFLTGSDK